MAYIVDAVGLDCPKPVILTKKAADAGEKEILVKVDNEVAVSNVMRFFESRGYGAERSDGEGFFSVKGVKQSEGGGRPKESAAAEWAVLFLSDKVGEESGGLGDALMKSCLSALAQNDSPPSVIALMNRGVLMALPENSTCDTLAELEKKGVRILVCGVCAKHFGVTEKVKVGVISNMFEITESVFGSAKPVVMG